LAAHFRKECPVRPRLLLLSAVLLALAVAPAASGNKPTREINPSQDDLVITDQCPFPVLAHIDGGEIVTNFTDKAGNLVKQIVVFLGNTQTLTNLDTGRSITLVATGSFQGRAHSDGSVSFKITGHGAFPSNPITGEPGIWYSSGRLFATFDAEGNLISTGNTGKLVDLCPRLAA
jgi:hypothetical protein